MNRRDMAVACGEYVRIMEWSDDPQALYEVHLFSMNPDEAEELVYRISDDHGKPRPTVSFTSKSGRYYPDSHRLLLPKRPLQPGGDWYGFLRLGIVLHEIAHALTGLTGGPHSRRFVETLDRLVAEYGTSFIEGKAKRAAGPKPIRIVLDEITEWEQQRLFEVPR